MKIFSSRKRVAAIGAVTAATLVGGGMAYAYWTTTGSGENLATTGDAVEFVVDVGDPVGLDLAPGTGSQTFSVSITNPETAGVQLLNVAAAKVALTDLGPAWSVGADPLTCTKDDFSVGAVTAVDVDDTLPQELAPGQTWEGSVTVSMINRATVDQEGCKNLAEVPLFVKAS